MVGAKKSKIGKCSFFDLAEQPVAEVQKFRGCDPLARPNGAPEFLDFSRYSLGIQELPLGKKFLDSVPVTEEVQKFRRRPPAGLRVVYDERRLPLDGSPAASCAAAVQRCARNL